MTGSPTGRHTVSLGYVTFTAALMILLAIPAAAQNVDSGESPQTDVPQQAELLLGDDPCSQPFTVLVNAIKSDDHIAKWNAAECLENTKDRRATVPLVNDVLTSDDVHLQIREWAALQSIDDPRTADLLLDALNVPATRREAAYSLGQLQIARGLQPLLEMLTSENSDDRTVAANALGAMKNVRAINPLIAVLGGEDIIMRRYAAIALGRIGDSRAAPALIVALSDADDGVRGDAAEALGDMKSTAAVPALAEKLSDPKEDRYVVGASAEALGKIADPSAVSALISALYSVRPDAQRKSAKALADVDTPQATQALIDGLRRGNLNVVGGAYSVFMRIGDDSFAPALIEVLKDDGSEIMAEEFACSGNARLAAAARSSPFADKLSNTDDEDSCSGTEWGSH